MVFEDQSSETLTGLFVRPKDAEREAEEQKAAEEAAKQAWGSRDTVSNRGHTTPKLIV